MWTIDVPCVFVDFLQVKNEKCEVIATILTIFFHLISEQKKKQRTLKKKVSQLNLISNNSRRWMRGKKTSKEWRKIIVLISDY